MARSTDSAVSPVVGVMLMLVVVIIIAAVVSAFAGGVTATSSKPPQASITGKYSYSSDIFQIIHAGGDELPTQKINIRVQQNDEDFGGFGSLFSQMGSSGMGLKIVNKSRICTHTTNGKCWLNAETGSSTDLPVFRPGDVVYYNESFKKAFDGFGGSEVVGRSLILEVDTIDGKLISKSKVMIDP